jgi:hypothetical protein
MGYFVAAASIKQAQVRGLAQKVLGCRTGAMRSLRRAAAKHLQQHPAIRRFSLQAGESSS